MITVFIRPLYLLPSRVLETLLPSSIHTTSRYHSVSVSSPHRQECDLRIWGVPRRTSGPSGLRFGSGDHHSYPDLGVFLEFWPKVAIPGSLPGITILTKKSGNRPGPPISGYFRDFDDFVKKPKKTEKNPKKTGPGTPHFGGVVFVPRVGQRQY